MVEHVDLDFRHEFLLGYLIPFHRHEFLRLFLVATDVAAGLMMNHQPFAGADVRDDRIAGNRTAALGERDQYAVGAL